MTNRQLELISSRLCFSALGFSSSTSTLSTITTTPTTRHTAPRPQTPRLPLHLSSQHNHVQCILKKSVWYGHKYIGQPPSVHLVHNIVGCRTFLPRQQQHITTHLHHISHQTEHFHPLTISIPPIFTTAVPTHNRPTRNKKSGRFVQQRSRLRWTTSWHQGVAGNSSQAWQHYRASTGQEVSSGAGGGNGK